MAAGAGKIGKLRRTQLGASRPLSQPPGQPPSPTSSSAGSCGCRPWDATLAGATLKGGGRGSEQQPGVQASRDQLPAGRDPPSLPGVAPGSVRTGLRSRIPALVARTPARCPGVPTRPLPASRAQDPSHRCRGSCRAGDPVPPPGRPPRCRGDADCPAGRLDPRAAPWPLPSAPEALADGRWLPRGARLHLPSARRDLPGRPNRPFLHAARLQHFHHRGEKRPRSQTKPANCCVTHLCGYLQSPNCLPGVLAETVRCLSLFFPGKKMD
ncbi:Multiple Pdz Domain Protein [Manis pentadactyla]|nr:Multiple Pdz Domain Protein [Manis pentadactyla]